MTRHSPLNLLFACLIALPAQFAAQGVGINTSTPHPSSLLELQSTQQGLLIPRMTQAQRDAIVNPAPGLQIYNIDTQCINLFTGTWRQICSECDFTPPAAGSNSPLCEGSTLTLSASTVPGATYQWTGPSGFTSSQQSPQVSGVTLSASGLYSVTATVNGCTSDPVSIFVIVNEEPAPPTLGNNGPQCEGNTIQLSGTSVSGAVFSWTGPGGFASGVASPSLTSVTPAMAGTYSATVTVNGCSSQPASTQVSVLSPPPAPGALTGPALVCPGQESVGYSIQPVAGASSYQWTGFTGAQVTSGQGTTNASFSFTSGSGSVCVAAVNGCGASAAGCLAVSTGAFTNGTQVLGFTGSSQNFTVPAGVTAIRVKAWGAGGGGGNTANTGGPGGYTEATIPVIPGETLIAVVGRGGDGPCNGDCSPFTAGSAYGGGAGGFQGNGGGGLCGLYRGPEPLLIAGGGGGGGGGNNSTPKRGGGGGGLTAQPGDDAQYGGKGGTPSAGGAGGDTTVPPYPGAGSSGQGGGGYYGGGGGGGYFGGGGGGRAGSWLHMGGGGGSSYVAPSASCTTILGGDQNTPSSPPNSADPDYTPGTAVGGNNGFGGHARMVIRW